MASLTVPATVMTVVALNEADQFIKKQTLSIKPVIAGFILGLGLFALQALDTRLGTLFAILVLLNAIIMHGLPVFNQIGKVTS